MQCVVWASLVRVVKLESAPCSFNATSTYDSYNSLSDRVYGWTGRGQLGGGALCTLSVFGDS